MNRCKKCGDEFVMQSLSNPIYCFQCSLIVLPEFEQQIAQLTKEREELAIQLRAWNSCFGTSQLTHASSLLDCAIRERDKLKSHSDQLAAKCASMVEGAELYEDAIQHQCLCVSHPEQRCEQCEIVVSARKRFHDQCGVGWLSPEKKKVLVEALEHARRSLQATCDDELWRIADRAVNKALEGLQ